MIEYEKLEQIVLLFWDSNENYELEKTQQKIGSLYKEKHLVTSLEDFNSIISKYNDDQQFLFFIHLSHAKENKGLDDFMNSKILRDHPRLRYYLITSARKQQVYSADESLDVFTYDKYQEKIFSTFMPQTKLEIINNEIVAEKSHAPKTEIPQIDYVIVTALEETEMEKLLPMIEKIGKVPHRNILIEYGHLKSNPQKKIAYSSQLSSGMIDAAVLCTEMINYFKPKFLIMAGVLGGRPKEVSIGDVIVATKVFTIDKGKETDGGFKRESEGSNTDSSYITNIKRNKTKISQAIKDSDATRDTMVNIHFGPIACVRSVIDKKGFFDGEISVVDRKTLALEMESYGVSRACELSNDGKTIPLIIKSAMDNTQGKKDKAKPYAAWTSAMVVNYILEHDII